MNTLFNSKKSIPLKIYILKIYFQKKVIDGYLALYFFLIFSSCAGIFLLLYYYQYAYVAYSLTFIPSVSILVYIYLITPYKIRQKLKSKNLPIPLNIFKWKSDELINLRIVEIYKGYYQENETTINKLIDISTELINEPIKNYYLKFENCLKKIVKWSCIILPILIAVFIPIFVDLLRFLLDNDLLLNKEEIKNTLPLIKEYFLYFSKLILLLFLYYLLFFLSYIMVRNDSLSRILDSKKELKEYVYILNNIHLLRLQEEKEKIIETEIKKPQNSLLALLRQLFN